MIAVVVAIAPPDRAHAHPLVVTTRRHEPLRISVGFPSHSGARVVVDASVNPLLGSIEPSDVPDRTVVVYRDGRVTFGAPTAVGPPAVRAARTTATLASPAASFTRLPTYLPPYYDGTLVPAWADLDGDGDLDLPLYRNDGGDQFSEMPGFRDLLAHGNYHGSSWCDFDGDGDLDLVILAYSEVPSRTLLLENQGNGTFVDRAPTLGMNVSGNGETPVWGDFDGDGLPDLFAPYYAHVAPFHSFLYHNLGNGAFVDVADSAGVALRGVPEELKPEGADAVDWDDDGDLDLYCASHLFINDGAGHFTDVRAQVGLPQLIDEGAAFVDYDGDGDFDLYLRLHARPQLYRNDAGHFTDVTDAVGFPTVTYVWSWGDSWVDVDNDGDLDFLYYVADAPAQLMINRGDGTFAPDSAFATLDLRGQMSAWGDYDGDGDLDLVDGVNTPALIANRLDHQSGAGDSYLRVVAVDAAGRYTQQGATVRLERADGTVPPLLRAVGGGSAYLSHNQYAVHLGLGIAGTVTRSPDLADYPPGTSVQLTAVPSSGYVFTGWSGGASGTANPVTVIVNGPMTVEAAFEPLPFKVWMGTAGGGDGTSWSSGANWSGGTVPQPQSNVVLDQTYVTGDYTVTLPGDAATRAVKSLRIVPGPGRSITLVVPSNNTANPGLKIGDGLPGTDDVVLERGATLRNASGATAGTGIALAASTDRIRIDDGGRYLHATLRSASGVVPFLSTVPGTRHSVVEYDVPGHNTYAILADATYPDLTLTRTAGNATYTAAGSPPLTVRGSLRINSKVTLTSTMTGLLRIGGHVTNLGANLALSQPVEFDGDSAQVVSGSARVQLAGASTVDSSATLAVGAATFLDDGVMTVRGALRLDLGTAPSGSGTYAYDPAGGTLILNNTGALTVGTVAWWPTSGGPSNVTVQGAGGITMGVVRTVPGMLRVAASVSRSDRLTLTGTARLEAGGKLLQAPVYAGEATLEYAAPMAVASEWGAGAAVGVGVPRHVRIDAGAGTVSLPATDRAVPGSLTVTHGTLAMNATAGNLTVAGDLAVDGALVANGRLFSFTGDGVQIVSGSGALSLGLVRLAKGGGSVRLERNLGATAGPGQTALAFDGTVDEVDLNGRALSLVGPLGGVNPGGRLRGSATSALTLAGSVAAGSLRFASGAERLGGLTVNLSGNAQIALATPLTVDGTLTLTRGRITTGSQTLAIGAAGSVARDSGFVEGWLAKSVASGVGPTVFEVGTGTVYAPFECTVFGGSPGGTLAATTTPGDPPGLDGSPLVPTRTVNRTWRANWTGAPFDSATVRLQFPAGEIDAAADPSGFRVGAFDGAVWSLATAGVRGPTSTAGTAHGLGTMAVGNPHTYTLDVTAGANGTVIRDPDRAVYEHGDVVTVTAVPETGYHLLAWGGDASGSQNPIPVSMLGNRTVTASFEINHYALTVTTAGGGRVTRAPDLASYPYGAAVTMTASPDSGFRFVGWSGDTTSGDTLLTLTMTADRSFTATFGPSHHALQVATAGPGSVTRDPALDAYPHGSPVTLTAEPAPGFHFEGWSGDVGGAANPITLTMDGPKLVTATFADREPPWVHVLAPNGGEMLAVGDTLALLWEASDAGSAVTVDLYLSREGSGGPFALLAESQPNGGSYSWVVTAPGSGSALIQIVGHDSTGNVARDTSDAEFEIDEVALAVAERSSESPGLVSVTPNPVSGRTSILYRAPAGAEVRVSISDLAGREVALLARGPAAPGAHAVTWNGGTPAGRAPPGVYFVRCEIGPKQWVRRVALLESP